MRRFIFLLFAMLLPLSMIGCSRPGGPAATPALTATPAGTATPAQTAPEETPAQATATTILLMGIGQATYQPGESYPYAMTHILITLDPAEEALKVTTLPYNLAVMAYAEGHELEEMQLQEVCASVGPDATAETLEKNFGITIDYYVVMNMLGIRDVVDALGGIEIDVDRLSINRASEQLMPMLGLAWEEITATGRQLLSGVQALGFFHDTYPEEDSADPLVEEELLFRDRHTKIISAVATAVTGTGLKAEDLAGIARGAQSRFFTDIPEEEWLPLAQTALTCLDNPVQYLHIPTDIQLTDISGLTSIAYDPDTDPAAVQAFIGE